MLREPHVQQLKKIFLLFFVLGTNTLLNTNAYAQLTGSVRSNFLQSYRKGCFETQRAGSPNVNISDETLRKYCNCLSINMADSMNNKVAEEIEKGNIKMASLVPASQLAEKYCMKNYQNY